MSSIISTNNDYKFLSLTTWSKFSQLFIKISSSSTRSSSVVITSRPLTCSRITSIRKVLWTRKGVRATVVTAGHCTHAELTIGHALASCYSKSKRRPPAILGNFEWPYLWNGLSDPLSWIREQLRRNIGENKALPIVCSERTTSPTGLLHLLFY